MERWPRAFTQPDDKFKELFGVQKETFRDMLAQHRHNRIPFKKSKNHPLTVDQKLYNRELSRERIVIENINAKIKTFKIMSERYRNR
jgi:hypothetical protein